MKTVSEIADQAEAEHEGNRASSFFSEQRLRRTRQSPVLRALVSETTVDPNHLVMPIFVREGSGLKEKISSMPGIFRFSPDRYLEEEMEEIRGLGINAVIIFGIPEKKDTFGSEAYDENGVVQKAVRRIKDSQPDLTVMCDVCLCEYTDHGHCGVLNQKGYVENDKTVALLARTAVSQVQAGADIVAPSAMMDNQVGAIRRALDSNGFDNSLVMSYSSKYASAFYGPFREAAGSTPSFGDRSSYQMDPSNLREAVRETALDVDQGADIIMVKPALPYLDVIREIRQKFNHPLAAYQVSGEYAMIKAAALNGWIDERRAVKETLTSIKRAGADMIISYFAKQYLSDLKKE